VNPFSELILSNAYGILPILVLISHEKFCVIVPVQVKLPVLFAKYHSISSTTISIPKE
jgi:hypothetical protein